MANDAGKILQRIKDEEIEWVDLRFTDPKGKCSTSRWSRA
jgi:glutamine synthetase